jgi:hypothetical protein
VTQPRSVALSHIAQPVFKPSISATDTSVPDVSKYTSTIFSSHSSIYTRSTHNILRQADRLLLCQKSFFLFLSASDVQYDTQHAASEVNLVVQRQGSASSRIQFCGSLRPCTNARASRLQAGHHGRRREGRAPSGCSVGVAGDRAGGRVSDGGARGRRRREGVGVAGLPRGRGGVVCQEGVEDRRG